MSKTYAVIENGTVVNVIVWDGETAIGFGGNQIAIQIAQSGDGTSAPTPGIGWSYANGVFIPPPEPEQTAEDLAAQNPALAQAAYNVATAKNHCTERADRRFGLRRGQQKNAVKVELEAWTRYRIALRAYIRGEDGSQPLPASPLN
ncbi:hypothetical protein ACP0HM_12180 [Escherichia coli]